MSYKESELDELIQEAFTGMRFELSPQKAQRLETLVNFGSFNPWTKQAIKATFDICLLDEPKPIREKRIQIGDLVKIGEKEIKLTVALKEALGL